MRFTHRYQISRLTDHVTEFYTGYENVDGGWSTDEFEAEQFLTPGKAERRSDRVGGEVFKVSRAPLGHSAEARLEYHFSQAAE